MRSPECTAHIHPRTIPVTSGTNKGGIRQALNRWQRVMLLEMLWFTHVFRGNCKIDKRGHLHWFIQEFGNHTQQNFNFE
jgi:hypothetical protein